MRRKQVILITVLMSVLLVLSSASCRKSPAPPSEPISDSVLDSKARSFVELMAAGKHADAVKMMDAKVASALPESQLKATWESLISQVGAFDGIAASRIADESGFRVVYVTCRFKSAILDTKVVFDAAGLVSGLWFVPSSAVTGEYVTPPYVNTDSFSEVECEIGSGKWVLPATLTMPKGEGPFPAVVLVHGSGPNDRDETIGPNKPFKDLAWGLASNGVAVLRYEKRTKHYQLEMASVIDTFTLKEETVDDALAAADYLKRTEGVDPEKVFIVGHSLGASSAPRIAATAAEEGKGTPAGLVMLAPNARPLLELMIEQYEYITSLDGQVTEAEQAELAAVRAEIAKIEGGLKPGESALGAPKAYWDDIMAYDPVAIASSLHLPMLVLQGERDYQVTMEDFAIWESELRDAPNVTLRSFPGLNHLFMLGEGKSSPDEYNVAGNVHSSVIETIADWVKTK